MLEQANQPQHTTWEYLKILFDENPRIALLKYLGLDGDKMSAEISAFIKAQDKGALTDMLDGEMIERRRFSTLIRLIFVCLEAEILFVLNYL